MKAIVIRSVSTFVTIVKTVVLLIASCTIAIFVAVGVAVYYVNSGPEVFTHESTVFQSLSAMYSDWKDTGDVKEQLAKTRIELIKANAEKQAALAEAACWKEQVKGATVLTTVRRAVGLMDPAKPCS